MYAYIIFLTKKVIFVKFAKSMALMAMGAGAVLAYQKYEKPVMKEASKKMKKVLKKSNQMLEDMN